MQNAEPRDRDHADRAAAQESRQTPEGDGSPGLDATGRQERGSGHSQGEERDRRQGKGAQGHGGAGRHRNSAGRKEHTRDRGGSGGGDGSWRGARREGGGHSGGEWSRRGEHSGRGGRPGGEWTRRGERSEGRERKDGEGFGSRPRAAGGEKGVRSGRPADARRSGEAAARGRSGFRGDRRREDVEFSRPGLAARADEPPTPEEFDESLLPPAVKAELKGLSRETAEKVGAHLIAAGELIDDNPELAYRHAEAARRRAARLPIVREAAAEAAYAAGEYAAALREFRALRRMLGSVDYLAVIADCERALGRPRAALEVIHETDLGALSAAQRIEVLIVEAGARSDLGQQEEAIRLLENGIRTLKGPRLALGRLRFAYAEFLIAAGHLASAKEWLEAVTKFDPDDELGATVRLAELNEG